ncbi:MAG: 30S ribosomal protein S16 [Patescibacteria group bacterium]|jgi:small subunit ribosomal protein S16
MLAIRLSPTGKKGQKFFRVIVSEKTKDVFGDYIELLGNYNPHPNPAQATLKAERIKYWLSQGAQASPTVHNLLVDQKIIDEPKVTSWKPKKKEVSPEEATKAATASEPAKAESIVEATSAPAEPAPEVTPTPEPIKPAPAAETAPTPAPAEPKPAE